jgi:hypothetical protein
MVRTDGLAHLTSDSHINVTEAQVQQAIEARQRTTQHERHGSGQRELGACSYLLGCDPSCLCDTSGTFTLPLHEPRELRLRHHHSISTIFRE